MRAIYRPDLRRQLQPLLQLIFALSEQETGVEYIRTTLYYLTRATERVSREALEQALSELGPQGEQVMATIAQEYIQQGLEQGLERSIMRILQRRFGELPPELPGRLAALPAAVLEALLDDALMAADYEAFADRLTVIENQSQ